MVIEEVIKFTSIPILNEHQKVIKVIDRAIIPIRIGYKLSHKISRIPVGCLLDSGVPPTFGTQKPVKQQGVIM